MDNELPPIGLIPKNIHHKKRIIDIIEAIDRYVRADEDIPREWLSELESLLYPLNSER